MYITNFKPRLEAWEANELGGKEISFLISLYLFLLIELALGCFEPGRRAQRLWRFFSRRNYVGQRYCLL